MSTQTLVPDPDRLEVLSLRVEQGTIILTARTCSKTARCPICGQPSARVHSRYRRRLADLPWQEIPARLTLEQVASWTQEHLEGQTRSCSKRPRIAASSTTSSRRWWPR